MEEERSARRAATLEKERLDVKKRDFEE